MQVEIGNVAGDRAGVGWWREASPAWRVRSTICDVERLGAAALFLAVACGVLFLWFSFTSNDVPMLVLVVIGMSGSSVAAAVAAILFSRMELSSFQVRGLEYLLFGAFTIMTVISQYQGNLDLLLKGDVIGVTAHVKDGIIGMFTLMVLYGMFIPNDTAPRHVSC